MLPFVLEGQVVRGKQLGTRLGFPTANIAYCPEERSWPREGVYAGIAQVMGEKRKYLAVLNQGSHPTAPGGAPTVEAHLIGYPPQALYGHTLRLVYCAFLRSEKQFPSLEALQSQLEQDCQSAALWAEENGFAFEPEGVKDGTEEV